MSIRCLVIDDEPLALNIIAGYIQQTNSLRLIDITTDPNAGLKRVMAKEVDLVFLDLEMPQLHGIDFLEKASSFCKFIVTTAYPEYALQGYEFSIADYLLKPISYEKFLKAVNKIPATANTELPADFIFVKSEYRLVRIELTEIIYLEALRDYVAIHTSKGRKLLTLQSLGSFEKEFSPGRFLRIHKSYIVSTQFISSIERNKVVIGDLTLPIGETYRKKVHDLLNNNS